MKVGYILAVSSIALSSCYSVSAWAQDNPSQASSEGTGNDIIVTARRVEERLQDVPISITVFNQEQISDRNVVTASDLAAYTPSLAVNQRWGPEKSSFAIRGFTQDQGTAPSVGVYFADVVAPRAYGGTTGGSNAPVGSFMDLQNVQVLKGPQGTLFGRNTTGGAVLLVPTKPTDRLEGNIEGSAGNFDMWRLQGVLNVPLAETFKVRLAVDRNHRRGYMNNKSGIGPDHYNDVNYFAARLSILAELTPDLENYTIATYSNSFTHGYGLRFIDCNPSPASGAALFNALPACDQIARQNARGDGPYDVDINAPAAYTNIKTWAVINTTTWKASDSLTIKNIASYQEYREQFANNLVSDNFTSRFPPLSFLPPSVFPAGRRFQYIYSANQPGTYNAIQSTFTEELQFQGGTSDGNLVWQAGGYFEKSDPMGFNKNITGIFVNCAEGQLNNLSCALPFSSSNYSDSWTKYWYKGMGIYAQATYKFNDQLSLTGGVRYTWDKVRALSWQTRLAPDASGTLIRTCTDVVRFKTATGGRVVVNSHNQCADDHFLEKSNKPTWLINLDYKPTEDIMLYAKYSRGYRAGSLNLTATGLEGWNPEKVDAYEVGAKTSFTGGSVRGYFNIAGFYNDFTNQQLYVQAIPDNVNFPGLTALNPIVNAGKSKIQGVEVDASATFFDSLKIDIGYTYLDTKLISIIPPPVAPPYSALRPITAVGGPLSYSPKNRVTLTGTYTLPLPENVGEISVGATYVHTDKQLVSTGTLPQYQFIPKSDIVNLNVNWDNVVGQPIDLAVFVTNVTNELYPLFHSASLNSSGLETAQYAPPRMWGVRVKYRFGD